MQVKKGKIKKNKAAEDEVYKHNSPSLLPGGTHCNNILPVQREDDITGCTTKRKNGRPNSDKINEMTCHCSDVSKMNVNPFQVHEGEETTGGG